MYNAIIERENYLQRLAVWIDKPIVKVITGQRRVGKSMFIFQIVKRHALIASDYAVKLINLLKPNAKVNYVVGNSSFYGHFVETQEIIAEIMRQIGYKEISIHAIRRRNTKKGLLEYNVRACWSK
jgi:hypothetical protein